MIKKSKIAIVAMFAAMLMFGCKKENTDTAQSDSLTDSEVKMIKAAGFDPEGAYKLEGKFLVEGDILLSSDELREISTNTDPGINVANDEHYRTTNLVTALPRTIKVRYTGGYTSISTALTNAIARYNAKNLRVKFLRVTTGQHINITTVSNVSYIASAGFPSGGNPYNSVKFNTAYTGWNANTLTTVIAHELGHCIGFRHTDYAHREYSCGGSHVSEGAGSIGAVFIPGTPNLNTKDAGSWMNACISNGVNRPFCGHDVIALNYVY